MMPPRRAVRRAAFATVVVASIAGVAYAAAPTPTAVCAQPPPGTTYTYSATANTATAGLVPPYGAVYDARTWPDNEMSIITGGQVNYVESTFEDDFGSFNLTRWMPTGSYSDGTTKPTVVTPFGAIAQGPSQDHCPAAGAVGAASPGTCTLLDPAMLETNVDLTEHGYVKDTAAVPADTGKGAVMTLSQSECYDAATGVNNPDCCSVSTLKNGAKTQVCASWAGTHISSNFGVQYGVLETEAAFNLTVNGGAYVFFGSYMYGGKIPTGATAVDQSWNEIDELVFNQNVGGANGYTYGTSLFVSEPAPALASKPYGYGAFGSAGLFSNHDQTAKCVLNSMCTAAQCSTGECNAGNMCCPTSVYGPSDIDMSRKPGYPAALVGNSLGGTIGGVPQAKAPAFGTSASIDPTKYNNYKLVWTPKWLAWMINSVVMRNESIDLGRQTVPWRPVTLRPLIRTNNGSAPIMYGTLTNAAHNPTTNPYVYVPAGAIYSTVDGGLISNHSINPTTHEATVKILPAQMTATTDAAQWAIISSQTGFWTFPSNCIPCNLLGTASTTAPATTLVAKTLYNAGIQFWEPSSVYVRRTKYTPYNEQSVTAALTQANSWASTNAVAYTVDTVGGACGSTVTKPAPTAATSTATPAVAPLPEKPATSGPAPVPTPAPPPGAAPLATPTPSMVSTAAAPAFTRTPAGKPFAATLAGTRNGDPIDWAIVDKADLMAAHSAQCQYMEADFEDDFNSETLNTSRWLPVGSVNGPPAGVAASTTGKYTTVWGAQPFGGYQDHCPSAGAVGAASPGTCTYIDPNALKLNADLPGYVTNGVQEVGAIASINQDRCYNDDGSNVADCCVKQSIKNKVTSAIEEVSVCASWSGSHLSSQGCIQYGILETEAAFDMPSTGGAIAFFGTYMFGGENPGDVSIGTTAATQIVDPQWNEIDIAFSNLTGTPMYGTSLFVSKQPFDYTTYGSNAGFGAVQPKGLFSGHDDSGTCVADTYCTAAAASASPPTCASYPMDAPTPVAAAIAAGMPATVAGGKGCPAYPSKMMTEYHNYKLVWTPTWLAWLVDDVVYRNESNQFRGMTKEAGMAYTPGYVPWRAVTMRPLLRTNIGSAPAITGKLKAACGSLAAGTEVTVPSGLIQVLDGTFVANHTIVGFGSAATATVNVPTNWDISLKTTKTYDYANNDCSPCNLLATEPTYLCKAAVLTAPALTFLPQSTMFIRRQKYTPFSEEAVAYAVRNAVSWKSGPSAAPGPVPAAGPGPAAPTPAGNQVTVSLNIAGFSTTTFGAAETEMKNLIAGIVGNGVAAADVTIESTTAGANFVPKA